MMAACFFVFFRMFWMPDNSLLLHPIHVSVSEIEIISGEINWSARIYKDDLLRGMYGNRIDMSKLDNPDKIEKEIFQYLVKNISASVNKKSFKWTLKQIDADPEAIWITVASPFENDIHTLTLHNRILLDIYDDQKNIVNISWNSGTKSLIFEKGRERREIVL